MRQIKNTQWKKNTERLARLLGSDEGFFALALHSFIEQLMKQLDPGLRYITDFPTKLDEFRLFLVNEGIDPSDLGKIIKGIGQDHNVTNAVRHSFKALSREEVISMTYNFLRFCGLLSQDCLSGLACLEENVHKVWDRKQAPYQQQKELKRLEYELFISQRSNRHYEQELQELKKAEEQEQISRESYLDLKQALKTAQQQLGGKDERIDQLRRELFNKKQEHRRAAEHLEEMEPLKEHISYLQRLSTYSRTRREYEQNILRLSPDQEEALGKIRLQHDFLIKGCAGTGKTLVLLKAFEKAFSLEKQELGLEQDEGKILLLTFTKALVRYDQYLSRILHANPDEGAIMTAESFFLSKLQAINPAWSVGYKVMEELSKHHNSLDFLDDKELQTEIEDFIFGGAVGKEEYIDQRIARKGLKKPLSQKQRRDVWDVADRIIQEMEERGVFSKNYAKLKILSYLEQHPKDNSYRDVRFIFVDEAQDLTAVELMTLKALAKRPVILAGDSDQTIYGFSSPYARAGINISGYTKILKLNFRNTVPIHSFAETYRTLSREESHDTSQCSTAFREGPVPELLLGKKKEILPALLDKIDFFIQQLGYDPENICILAPTGREIKTAAGALAERGIAAETYKDNDFDFSNTGKVRLFTLHSSKGIDFPVVILYLPYLPYMGQKSLDHAALEKIYHNLVYVACTRAMDHLIIGIPQNSTYQSIQELETSWEKLLTSSESMARE